MDKYSSAGALNLPEIASIPTREEIKKSQAVEEKKAKIEKEAPPQKDIQTLMVNGVSMDIDMDT